MGYELHEHLALEFLDNGCSLFIQDFVITLCLLWLLSCALVLFDKLSQLLIFLLLFLPVVF